MEQEQNRETFFQHFGLDNSLERILIYVEFKGDHWQEGRNVYAERYEDFNDFCSYLEEIWTDINYDYFNPEEDGLYRDECENDEEYEEEYDELYAESQCYQEIILEFNGHTYSLDVDRNTTELFAEED